ncbi:MAG: glycosyltransferase family 39 protein [Isosphaeraceae bacterium]|nr:glycosyltransferase family 39 protein [Isosphaeraceae bacterium]
MRIAAAGVVASALALMLATEPKLAIVWDEGFTLGREERIRLWIRALRDPVAFAAAWKPPTLELVQPDSVPLTPPRPDQVDTRAELFEPRTLAYFWPFAREEPHGHPPFYAILGLLGDVVVPSWAELPRARFGPIVAFSLLAGAIFLFLGRRYGVWAGAVAAGAWVFQPNLFGHAHYAAYDAPLTCLWVAAVLSFVKALEPPTANARLRWGWVALFGVLCGWAADTKLTGWFLPLPFLVWSLVVREKRAVRLFLVAGVIAAATLYLFNPGWWSAPIGGIDRFLRSNLSRGKTIPIEVMFLGKIYRTPNESLPPWNTLVWTLFVTPVGLLTLAMVGVGRSLSKLKVDPFGLLVVGHWSFLMLLRALPNTPGHDGVRLFLPAFGLLALLAGLGAGAVVERVRLGRLLCGAALAEAVASTLLMLPVPLSYYSPIVGGLPGATKLGMEPTYYWDALTPDALEWLNRNTPPGGKVRFSTFPTSWLYLARTKALVPEILPGAPGRTIWYVVQNRPGSMRPVDREILARMRPAYVVEKFGVPLVWIFPDPFGN